MYCTDLAKEPSKTKLYSVGYARAEGLRTKGDLEVLMERLNVVSGCVPMDEGEHMEEAAGLIEQAIDALVMADRVAEQNRMEG